jgi:hypothetical protein
MERDDTANVSHNFCKILMSNLIEQISEYNFAEIKKTIDQGFIDDSNNDYNESFTNIKIEQDFQKYKENIIKLLNNENLYHETLLVSWTSLVSTNRCGYDRYGKCIMQ